MIAGRAPGLPASIRMARPAWVVDTERARGRMRLAEAGSAR